MVATTQILARLVLAASVASALPLNINLGAYSPALVVGDGEISFDGSKTGSTVANALQNSGAVVATPAGVENVGGQTVAQTDSGVNVIQADPEPAILSEPASLPQPGSSKELDPRLR